MTDAWLLTRVVDRWPIAVVADATQAVKLLRSRGPSRVDSPISVEYNEESHGGETIYLPDNTMKAGNYPSKKDWYDISIQASGDKYRLTRVESLL